MIHDWHFTLLWQRRSTAVRVGAGDGNRTHLTSLEGWRITLMLRPHRMRPPSYTSHRLSVKSKPVWLLNTARGHHGVGHTVENLLIGRADGGEDAAELGVVAHH